MGTWFSRLFGGDPVGPNPTLDAIIRQAFGQGRPDRAQGAEEATRETTQNEREARAAQLEAERTAREAEEKASEAETARREAERKWKEGIQPEVWPTAEELEATKQRHQYTEGLLHLAIAGIAGSGKSSLINAIRGLRRGPGSAPTGVTETTLKVTPYPDPNPEHPFVWYDIPGAGTLNIPDWEYFNAQGLYIFDCIIVLFDNRFTATDVAILKNCERFKIPSYIVRSKANQHITNIMQDMDSDDEGDTVEAAREKFVTETRESVRVNLEKAGLPPQRVYIVSKDTLFGVVKDKGPRDIIDELELVKDLLSDARARRPPEKKGWWIGNVIERLRSQSL